MKKFLLIVILLGAVYYIYNKFYNNSPVEIKDNIIVTQASSLDINSASVTPPPRYASVEGEIKNTGKSVLTNVVIYYSVGIDTLSSIISSIGTGELLSFKTNSCKVRVSSPRYSLIGIKFEEE